MEAPGAWPIARRRGSLRWEMNRFAAASIAALVLLALIGSAWVLHRVEARSRSALGWESELSVRMHGTTLAAYDGDREQWRMRVDRIELRQDPNGPLDRFRRAELEGIRDGAFYDARGRQATFRAARAVADGSTNAVRMTGAVGVRTRDGDRLDAPEAEWDPTDPFVRFPRGARAVVQSATIHAPLVLYSPRYRLLQCPLGAEMVDAGRRIRAAALFWDARSGEVECPAGVALTTKDLDVSARSARLNVRDRILRANGVSGWIRIEKGFDGVEAVR